MIYPNTAVIVKKTTAQTAAGTVNPTYSTRIAALACSIQYEQLATTDTFGKPTLVNVYTLFTPIDSVSATIDESDRVTYSGKTFEITGIGDGAGRGHHYEIDMLEVKI